MIFIEDFFELKTMRKILFVAVAFTTVAFASCGGSVKNEANACDTDTVVVDSVDTVAVADSTVCLD